MGEGSTSTTTRDLIQIALATVQQIGPIALGVRPQEFETEFDANGNPTGYNIETLEFLEWKDVVSQFERNAAFLTEQGINPHTGEAIAPTVDSGARTDTRLRAEEETRKRERVEDKKARDAEIAEQKRQDTISANIESVHDMLANSIQRGEISRLEADRRTDAAVSAADIERSLINTNIGRSLPKGTEFFPNLEPGSAFGNVFQSLTGDPFSGFRTGGTIPVSPTGITAPIRREAAASSLPRTGEAAQNAQRMLAQIAQQYAVGGVQNQSAVNAGRAFSGFTA